MAKFSGKIGFVKTIESEPGIWVEDEPTERVYYGDILRNMRNSELSSAVNGNINIANNISIISDKYANENFQYMKYVVYKNIKWNINSASLEYPRIVLNIGGVYNG